MKPNTIKSNKLKQKTETNMQTNKSRKEQNKGTKQYK
jgi:hypothetical protein